MFCLLPGLSMSSNPSESDSEDAEDDDKCYPPSLPFHHHDQFFRDPFFSDMWIDLSPSDRLKLFDNSFRDDVWTMPMWRNFSSVLSRIEEISDNSSLTSCEDDEEDEDLEEIFRLIFDMRNFNDEDVKVTIDDHMLIVKASHEEREDGHGYSSRSIVRKVSIPKEIETENISCHWTCDGMLVIQAPKNEPTPAAECDYEKVE